MTDVCAGSRRAWHVGYVSVTCELRDSLAADTPRRLEADLQLLLELCKALDAERGIEVCIRVYGSCMCTCFFICVRSVRVICAYGACTCTSLPKPKTLNPKP